VRRRELRQIGRLASEVNLALRNFPVSLAIESRIPRRSRQKMTKAADGLKCRSPIEPMLASYG